MRGNFWDGFWFGAGFAGSQLIFIFICISVFLMGFITNALMRIARRKKSVPAPEDGRDIDIDC